MECFTRKFRYWIHCGIVFNPFQSSGGLCDPLSSTSICEFVWTGLYLVLILRTLFSVLFSILYCPGKGWSLHVWGSVKPEITSGRYPVPHRGKECAFQMTVGSCSTFSIIISSTKMFWTAYSSLLEKPHHSTAKGTKTNLSNTWHSHWQ